MPPCFGASLSQHSPFTSMRSSDDSSPFYLADPYYPFYYGQNPSSPSQIWSTSLPDLYYDYRLETSPLSSTSEMTSTSPSVQTPPLTWEFAEPAYALNLTCHPNTIVGMGMEMTCYETTEASESAKRPESLIDCPPTTNSVSPADTLLDFWALNSTSYPTPQLQSPPKLHQPRPFRRIPIVNLDELASAYDPSPDSQTSDRRSTYQRPKQLSARLRDPAPGSAETHQPFVANEQRVLCPCGCMESYSLQ